MKSDVQRVPNVHNDYLADLLETVEDCRDMMAVSVAEEKLAEVRDSELTRLPADHPDFRQVVRHLDAVVGVKESKTADGKVSYKHTYLLECKSELRDKSLLSQLLVYILILLKFCMFVTPIVIYTGKRPLSKASKQKRIRPHAWLKTLIANTYGLSLTCIIFNLAEASLDTLLRYAPGIAAGLYLAKHIYELTNNHIKKFFLLCDKLPDGRREKMVEKGCVYIIKCGLGHDWDSLGGLECEVLPERRRTVSRVAFTSDDVRAQGKVEGKAEERSQIALAMLKAGEPEAKICGFTGLSRKELALLKRSLPK